MCERESGGPEIHLSTASILAGILSIALTTAPAVIAQLPAQPSRPVPASDACADARSAYAVKRFPEAADLFAACAAANPASPDALLLEGRALDRAGDFERAESVTRRFLAAHPSSAEGMYLLGYVLAHRNQPKESLEWFTKGAAQVKPRSEDLRVIAIDYVLLDDYHDAQHWLERAVGMNPRNAEAWYDLGRARMMQGNFDGGRKALEAALKLDPQSVKAENNLGLTYEAENRTDAALAAYQAAVNWQKTDPHPSEQPLLNLGTLLITQQRSAEAIPVLEEAIRIAAGSVKSHEQLARAYEQVGRSGDAESEMKRAVSLDPSNPRLHFELGQMYRRAGKIKESREELQRTESLYGSHSTPTDH